MEETIKTSCSSLNTNAKSIFTPRDSTDHACDVILVVNDGKIIKAHKDVLVGASPFFEKLFNTDMKESREGVIHLKMLTESALGDILEFMYTGCVQITNEDQAQVLIEMADYFFLLRLKCLAESALVEKLNCSNCLSLYRLAEAYNCEKLFSRSKTFILDNFQTVSTTEEFLNIMSSNEVAMWISSDDINVRKEEDVFEFILTWIDHGRFERSKFFEELFRHVRLAFIPNDYLKSNIKTNRLVKCNEGCLRLIKATVKSAGKANSLFWQKAKKPRKSLETPVMLLFERRRGEHNICYFPRENKWCRTPSVIPSLRHRAFSSQDKLYMTAETFVGGDFKLLCYDSFSNRLTSLSTLCSSLSLSKGVDPVCHIFVRGGNEIFALVGQRRGSTQERHLSCITRYNPESGSWEDVSTFNWDSRTGVCIVSKNNFVYFLGGRFGYCWKLSRLNEAHRFDLCANKWERVADMNEGRCHALGAVAHGKVFVIGRIGEYCQNPKIPFIGEYPIGCEVYDETTDEWHITASLPFPRTIAHRRVAGFMCIDDSLYALCEYSVDCTCSRNRFSSSHGANCEVNKLIIIFCYDPDEDHWTKKTQLPCSSVLTVDQVCSLTVFNRSKLISNVSSENGENTPMECESLNQRISVKQNCLIM
ncbi:kelch-like protein 12 [Montipora capricornis]|uniref:kelch-like protein 12 n=1 Tax=Montipora capricornis TaxID=246305 RepID=UPI0035F21403